MKLISVKLPQPLFEQIEAQRQKEDKDNRNAYLCELLATALQVRASTSKGEGSRQDELKDICTTKVILQIQKAVGEILRYTHNPKKSKYPECETIEALTNKIEKLTQKTLDSYK